MSQYVNTPTRKIILLSGLSGAGKMTALHILEDFGFHGIANLPAELIEPTVASLNRKSIDLIAISLDPLDKDFNHMSQGDWTNLTDYGYTVEIILLTATIETLQRRFSDSQRKHPLALKERSILEALQMETHAMLHLHRGAHSIDTSNMTPIELMLWLKEHTAIASNKMCVVLNSFGYKHGLPNDVDLVFDVRCLTNPYYVESLRSQTGLDDDVMGFLQKDELVVRMIESITTFIQTWYKAYEDDNRKNLQVGIGCTGGQHRSVYVTEQVAHYLRGLQLNVQCRHRERHHWTKT